MNCLTLCCRAFFLSFLEEFEEEGKNVDWQKIYPKNKLWTARMLGTGKSRRKGNHGLVGRVGEKFGYEISPEWRRIDQVWYYLLPKPDNWEDAPWKNDVLIEHDNDICRMEYTLFKFDEISAPLKVFISYPGDNEKDCLKVASEIIEKQVTSYPGEVYLMIFGFCDDKNGVYWHAYEIDFKGNITQIETE